MTWTRRRHRKRLLARQPEHFKRVCDGKAQTRGPNHQVVAIIRCGRGSIAGILRVRRRTAPHASYLTVPTRVALSLVAENIPQTDMNIAAITGPMTKPFTPKMAIPPSVEIRTT